MKQLSETRISLMKAATAPLTPVARQSIDQLTRHVRLFGKFFRRLQQLDSGRFVKLPACSELVLYYWDKVVEAANAPAQAIAGTWMMICFPYYSVMTRFQQTPMKRSTLYAFWSKRWSCLKTL